MSKHNAAVILVHYGEVALRGRNRPQFEEQLVSNIKGALKAAGLSFSSVRRVSGRLVVAGVSENQQSAVAEVLRRVFGVVLFAFAIQVEAAYEPIEKAVLYEARGLKDSFRIEARRATKNFALTSYELNERLGRAVQKATAAPVNLSRPAKTFFVDIVERQAYIYTKKHAGPGGLPVGASARAAVLLSGGIDSPVAAWFMAKRGCPLTLVHFHSYPYTSRQSQENVRELAQVISQWAPATRLFTVPLGEIQQCIIAQSEPKYRVLLYRRAMVKLAEQIAQKENALALVTGESVGQVASQTIENIRVVNAASTLPILRPLVGFDKTEIIQKAKAIGTYEISIRPYDDCCSFMVPEHPATKARLKDVEKAEAKIDFGEQFQLALANVTTLTSGTAPNIA